MRRSGKYEVCELAGNPKLECIWEARAELGESAIWVDDEQALYFVDGLEGRLLRYSESEGTSEVYRHDGVIGFIARLSVGWHAGSGLRAARGIPLSRREGPHLEGG